MKREPEKESLDAKCHKHLFLDDAIASVLRPNEAGALRLRTRPTLHLEVAHRRQVWTCFMQTCKRRHTFFKSQMNHTRAAFIHPFLRSEESPFV